MVKIGVEDEDERKKKSAKAGRTEKTRKQEYSQPTKTERRRAST